MLLNSYKKIKNWWYFKKKKIFLAVFFTLVVFFLLLFFQAFFLGGKYFNHKRNQLLKLSQMSEMMTHTIKDIRCWHQCHPQDFKVSLQKKIWKRNDKKKLPFLIKIKRFMNENNFVLFNKDLEVLHSSIDSEFFFEGIRQKILDNDINKDKNVFEYEWKKFFYKLSNIKSYWNSQKLLVFKYSFLTLSDVFSEFFSYSVFVLFICIILFFVFYYFVSYALKPVEENIKDMEQFIHNAWHELKTPVSSSKSSLQVAQKTWDYLDSMDETVYELDRMASLIDSLIQLSTIKKNDNNQEFSVSKLIKEIIDNYKQEAEKKHIKLYFEKKEDFCLKVNPDYFRIFVSNFVSNAIRHNNNWSKVELTVSDKYLEIKDDGEGMDKEVKEKMFERFFKGFEWRESQGFWIGLSLVKKIADIYWWKIYVESTLNKWTIFRIYF